MEEENKRYDYVEPRREYIQENAVYANLDY